MTYTYKDFIEKLIQVRTSLGVSSRDLSIAIGLQPETIYKIENGDELLMMPEFFNICRFLKITPMDFFAFKDEGYKTDEYIKLFNLLTNDQKVHILNIIKAIIEANEARANEAKMNELKTSQNAE